MTPRDREAEALMLSLRLTRGLDMAAWGGRLDPSFLERCEAGGYAVREDGRWRLTPRGILVSNPIIGELLDQLQKE